VFTILAALLLVLVSLLNVDVEWRKIIMCTSGGMWLLSGVIVLVYEIKNRPKADKDK
jgi:hypothetical protein